MKCRLFEIPHSFLTLQSPWLKVAKSSWIGRRHISPKTSWNPMISSEIHQFPTVKSCEIHQFHRCFLDLPWVIETKVLLTCRAGGRRLTPQRSAPHPGRSPWRTPWKKWRNGTQTWQACWILQKPGWFHSERIQAKFETAAKIMISHRKLRNSAKIGVSPKWVENLHGISATKNVDVRGKMMISLGDLSTKTYGCTKGKLEIRPTEMMLSWRKGGSEHENWEIRNGDWSHAKLELNYQWWFHHHS